VHRHIAFFLTGHGFGHGVRSSALINALPEDIRVSVFTTLPSAFFAEEVKRVAPQFTRIECEIDCGCVQFDTVSVDIAGTLAKYAALNDKRESLIAHYAAMLRASGADAVVGDIPPLAFRIAKAAGLPSVAVGNFAWTDIYADYAATHPEAGDLVRIMREDYACADLHVQLEPYHGESFEALGVRSERVGLLARVGETRRAHLAEAFGLDPHAHWCLIYVGSHGLPGVDWPRLKRFPDWQFMGLYDLPGAAANYRRIDKGPDFSYADLTASCDLVLGKLGYGLVGEAMANATPIVFSERHHFSEYSMLKNLVENRGLGRELSLDALRRLDLEACLNWALGCQPISEPAPAIPKILKLLGY
jgi:hypothetical protein